MSGNLTTNEIFATNFGAMSREEQLQYLNTVSDKMRSLRRQVLDTQVAESLIDRSTRTFAQGWQDSLKTDIGGSETNSYGQTITIDSRALEFYAALDAM